MTTKNTSRTHLLSQRGEQLETRTVLSGAAIVQPFADVDYFGSGSDWSINAINAPEVWSQDYTGQDIVVAVIDTGVDIHHIDLESNLWTNPLEIPGNELDDDGNGFVDDVHGWDFIDDKTVSYDPSGHGTHVAGTIAGNRNDIGSTGVAYNAQIMPIRVLDAEGIGIQLDISAGIRYAVENGADIINMSLGGTGSRNILNAVRYAQSEGVLIVAAAGNDGLNEPQYPALYSRLYDNVLSVGAYTSEFEIANFSNAVGNSNAVQVDAPGVGVYSSALDNGFRYSAGTSVATPHVSGIAALALSADPSLSPAELRDIIIDGADAVIDGSDSIGGINAALTVALAAENSDPIRFGESASSGTTNENTDGVPDEEEQSLSLTTQIPGDIDGNGEVDFNDFLIFSRNFGTDVVAGSLGDFDENGEVDFNDFLTFSRNFGSSSSADLMSKSVDDVFAAENDIANTALLEGLFTQLSR